VAKNSEAVLTLLHTPSTGIYIGVGVAAAVALVVLVAVAVVVHKRRPRRVLAEGMASTSGHSSSAF